MRRGFERRVALLGMGSCAALGAAFLSVPAYAQNATASTSGAGATRTPDPAGVVSEETGNGQLADIVVTAEKRSENLQATAIAISAFTPATLAARGTQSLLDLNTQVPNLFVGGAGAAGQQAGTFFIRGVGVDIDTLAKEPGVGLYIDDFYYGHTAGSLLSVLDIDTIEVLRGPQGTLFGKNTIGGAIRYNSVKPSPAFGGYADVNVGLQRRLDFKGAINIPLSETLSLRLTGATLNQDGYVYDIPLKQRLGDNHTESLRGQLRYKTGRFTADFSADYTSSRSNGQPSHLDVINGSPTSSLALYNKIVSGTAPVPFYSAGLYAGLQAPAAIYDSRYLADPYSTYATNVGYKLDGFGVSLTMAYDLLDNLTIKSLTGYRKNRVLYRNDNDQSPLNWNQNNIHENLPEFSQELQALGSFANNRIKYIVGLYYYRETPTSINDRMFPGEPDGNQQFDNVKTTSKAVFGQVDFEPIKRVTITLGGRYSSDIKDASSLRTKVLLNAAGLGATPEAATATGLGYIPTTAVTFGPISGAGHATFNNFSPKAAVKLQITDEIMTYGSVSRGYRAGGFNNGIAVYNPVTLTNPNNGVLPFQNETDWSYEIGVRSEFFDRHLRANISLFDSEYNNLQISSAQITGVGSAAYTKIDNVAKARLRGVEGEFLLKVRRDLSFGANFGILNSKYLQIASTVTAVNLTSRLAGAPSTTYSLNGTFNPTLANGADVAFNLEWGHQSSIATATSAATAVILPAYGLLNGSVYYNFPGNRISVGVTAKNILNVRYLISGVSLVAVPAGNAGVQSTNIGRPAEAYASVKVRF